MVETQKGNVLISDSVYVASTGGLLWGFHKKRRGSIVLYFVLVWNSLPLYTGSDICKRMLRQKKTGESLEKHVCRCLRAN